VEKKSEITVGGVIVEDAPNGPAVVAALEEITTVDNPRRRPSVPPALSPEHAQALRQVRHEPEPIPEGALYHVRAYAETGEPASDALLDQTLGGGTATNLAAPMTHAEAVTMCLAVNEKLQALDSPIWLGVFGVDEAVEAI
jgi:hypothetical protein